MFEPLALGRRAEAASNQPPLQLRQRILSHARQTRAASSPTPIFQKGSLLSGDRGK